MYIEGDAFSEFETSWKLKNICSGDIIAGNETSLSTCVDEDARYKYTILDLFGDGICCENGNGYYQLFVDGVLIQQGGEFAFQESTFFGPSCDGTPTASPTELVCDANEKELTVELTLDAYGEETTWSLFNECTFEFATFGNTTETLCINPAHNYNFTIYDSMGDGMCCEFGLGGYKLTIDGEVIKEGGEFGFEDSTTFGGGCVSTTPTYSPTDAGACPAGEFLGSTIYLALANNCFKIELFPGGVIAADPGDTTCSNSEHNPVAVVSTFDMFEGTRMHFTAAGAAGYNGVFEFEEGAVSDLTPQPRQLPNANNDLTFILGLIYPSCDQGPVYPLYWGLIEDDTLYFQVLSFCVKAEIKTGGLLSLDATGSGTCSSSSFTESMIISVMYDGYGNEVYFSPLGPAGYTGKFELKKDTGLSEIEVVRRKVDTTNKEFDLLVTLPSSLIV